MRPLQGNLCLCPHCGEQCEKGGYNVSVQTYRTPWRDWVRWTQCEMCKTITRQVYDQTVHRFSAPLFIETDLK